MIGSRRIYKRPYFWEVFSLVNLLVIYVVIARESQAVLETLPQTLTRIIPTFLIQTVVGVLVRLAVLRFRGDWRAYLRRISTSGWISDTLRLSVIGTLMIHTYSWIKLSVPLFRPKLYDQALWDLDQALFFGISPTVFFLALFDTPVTLKFFDWTYARIFVGSLNIAMAFFLSAPERRLRIAFVSGNALMWITSAWLYMAIPSLGPAYRFPDVWWAVADSMKMTHYFQASLMKNYLKVLRLREGVSDAINVLFGIAAFPSMHVGWQTYVFLWMRRVWIWGQLIFGVFLLVIFLGSVITGWHYLIDSIAGLFLAMAAYLGMARLYRIRPWRRRYALARGRK